MPGKLSKPRLFLFSQAEMILPDDRMFYNPDYDPLPHIPVVEVVSEEEVSEVESLAPQFRPK